MAKKGKARATRSKNGGPRDGKRQPTGEYSVGNCCPPKEHQFRKGEPSPNPSGRPRGKPKSWNAPPLNPAFAEILRIARETTKVNGQETTYIEAAFKTLVKLGLVERREKSLHKLLDMHAAAEQGAFDEKVEMAMYAIKHKEKWGPRFAQCEAEGKPVPNILPHPEDLTFDNDGNVVILGAVEEEGLRLQNLRESELRKRLEVMQTIRETHGPKPRLAELDSLLRRLEREAARLNNLLPPRLRVNTGIKRSEAVAELKKRNERKRPGNGSGGHRKKSEGRVP